MIETAMKSTAKLLLALPFLFMAGSPLSFAGIAGIPSEIGFSEEGSTLASGIQADGAALWSVNLPAKALDGSSTTISTLGDDNWQAPDVTLPNFTDGSAANPASVAAADDFGLGFQGWTGLGTGSHGAIPATPPGPGYPSVPETTTMLAGVLMLLPFGVSTLRMLRKRQVA